MGGGIAAAVFGQPRATPVWIVIAVALGLLAIAGHAILSGMIYAREKEDEEGGA